MSPPQPEIELWRRLAASKPVREQQMAFTCATGVPLTLVAASTVQGALAESAFCVKGCLGEPSGELCQQKLLKAERKAVTRATPIQYSCPSGLLKIVVPVFIQGRHAGSLLAGPFSVRALDSDRLTEQLDRLTRHGLGDRGRQLRKTWRYSPQLSSEKCRAAGTLLRMFARYLEEVGHRLQQSDRRPSSPLLRKVEAFLAENRDDRVSLKEMAARVNLSPCHFCAVFKKQTGLTFTEYRRQQRLEKARDLLRDVNRRVSDVAFEAGFESIPYFNRAFRRRFGCSPSEFRRRSTSEIQDKETEIQA